MTTTPPKFCKDCVHYSGVRGKFAECSAPLPEHVDLVSGTYNGTCKFMREEKGACGIEAKFFKLHPCPDSKFSADLPLVIYAPPATGKSALARIIANHFSKSGIVDDWSPDMRPALTADTVAFTNMPNIPGALPLGGVLIRMGADLLYPLAAAHSNNLSGCDGS